MNKFHYTLAFLCLTSSITILLYGYKSATNGQQQEVITVIDGKSATGKDKEHSKRFTRYKTGRKLTEPAFLEQQSNELVVKKSPLIIDIKLNGKIITAVVPSFRPFIEGDRYVLFLKFIPETQSYQAFSNGSFSVEEGKVRTSSDSRSTRDQQAFIAEVKDAMTGEPCQNVVLN